MTYRRCFLLEDFEVAGPALFRDDAADLKLYHTNIELKELVRNRLSFGIPETMLNRRYFNGTGNDPLTANVGSIEPLSNPFADQLVEFNLCRKDLISNDESVTRPSFLWVAVISSRQLYVCKPDKAVVKLFSDVYVPLSSYHNIDALSSNSDFLAIESC
ncbi:hypothetical protein Tco_1562158 [Tanacetum coccineum]